LKFDLLGYFPHRHMNLRTTSDLHTHRDVRVSTATASEYSLIDDDVAYTYTVKFLYIQNKRIMYMVIMHHVCATLFRKACVEQNLRTWHNIQGYSSTIIILIYILSFDCVFNWINSLRIIKCIWHFLIIQKLYLFKFQFRYKYLIIIYTYIIYISNIFYDFTKNFFSAPIHHKTKLLTKFYTYNFSCSG